jgi:hypothetical protein
LPNNRFERDAAKSAAPLKRIVRARAIVGVGSMFKIFRKAGVEEKINLQREGSEAKPYQVRQVRAVILKYRLGGQES